MVSRATTRRSSTPKATTDPETRFRFRLALALGVPSPRALAHLLPARELDQWRTFMELEPTGWEALNFHQAAVRLPHYKPGTRLDQLLFSDPGDPKNPPSGVGEPAAVVADPDQAPAKPPAGGTLTSEQLIAWTEAALQLGVPGITRGDPAPKQASDPDPGPENPISNPPSSPKREVT